MVPSTHLSPASESAWLVPPGSAISTECGNSLRTTRLPWNGVAASRVWSISRALRIRVPFTLTGWVEGAGQKMHGALNQAFHHAANGAFW